MAVWRLLEDFFNLKLELSGLRVAVERDCGWYGLVRPCLRM
jgi:hypothetical protein